MLHSEPLQKLQGIVSEAQAKDRKIHYLPCYRTESKIHLAALLETKPELVNNSTSIEFINAIIALRSVKEEQEVHEIEQMIDVAFLMHTTAMKMAKVGITESEIAGKIEGICLSHGHAVSFPVICSIHGETLHNPYYNNTLSEGRLLLTDAGAESVLHYASDITRTTPVGGRFNNRQREIYEIVLKANMEVINVVKPGSPYKDAHFAAAKVIA